MSVVPDTGGLGTPRLYIFMTGDATVRCVPCIFAFEPWLIGEVSSAPGARDDLSNSAVLLIWKALDHVEDVIGGLIFFRADEYLGPRTRKNRVVKKTHQPHRGSEATLSKNNDTSCTRSLPQ